MTNTALVRKLHYHKRSKQLELHFADGSSTSLAAEFLRVHSPSAEVQGHGNPVLVVGKQQVGIERLEPSGHYGVRICFDDGHQSGIYRWPYLQHLANHHTELWQQYQQRLTTAKAQQENVPIRFIDAANSSKGHSN
ncbi:gamma-butyrobetaine hydroxylase-like domain-containing protein [Alkalimonas amylolytica]|uniref:DUF971 family protein n=1 Tax=Alkalimonas amylolytica TaxID=152573 RepID=A0A1H3XZ69_ALKAM|nr:gamma-butyrobetaine hydroxylase-like domain-containing protein [Alkalimonas amylolytica]SEA04666.1 DUF971 family protein [Alkalimonas amylolytica]